MRIDIRVHTDHITTDDLAVFAALAALTPGTPTPTTAVLNGVKGAPEVSPEPAPKTAPARPAARKAPAAKPAPEPAPTQEPEEAAAPVEAEPTETKLAAAKRELTEEVTKLARSGPEGRARAKKALIGAGVERVSEVKTLTVAKAVLAALAEGDEADDLA
jgi:outer membrane biosynthesis protein TonB